MMDGRMRECWQELMWIFFQSSTLPPAEFCPCTRGHGVARDASPENKLVIHQISDIPFCLMLQSKGKQWKYTWPKRFSRDKHLPSPGVGSWQPEERDLLPLIFESEVRDFRKLSSPWKKSSWFPSSCYCWKKQEEKLLFAIQTKVWRQWLEKRTCSYSRQLVWTFGAFAGLGR